MTTVKLFRWIDRFARTLESALDRAGLHEVTAPVSAHFRVSSYGSAYTFAFEVLAASGLPLRFEVPVERTELDGRLDDLAGTAVMTIERARREREALWRSVDETARRARRAFARCDGEGGTSTPVAVRVAPFVLDQTIRPQSIEVEYEGLDDRLRPWRDVIPAAEHPDLTAVAEKLRAAQSRRAENQRRARAVGGIGLIDEVTLRAIDAGAGDPPAFLRALVRRHLLLLNTPWLGRQAQYNVSWKDGVARFGGLLTDEASYYSSSVNLSCEDRDLDPRALAGTRLNDLIQHPLLPDGLLIEEASWMRPWPSGPELDGVHRGRMSLRVSPTLYVLDMDGAVIPETAGRNLLRTPRTPDLSRAQAHPPVRGSR